MLFLRIALGVFILLEVSNVITLYLKPDSTIANGIGVFKAFEKSKKYTEVHKLVKYLVYWVAGTKLIFLSLLTVILIYGTDKLQLIATMVLVLSISSFYWKLFPLARQMDKSGNMSPNGYSKVLGIMIGVFIGVFIIAIGINFQ